MEGPPNKQVVDYFMQITHEKFANIEKKLERIDHKMEKLIGFRWMMIGAAVSISAIVSLAIQILQNLRS